jgi:hypothetical protein
LFCHLDLFQAQPGKFGGSMNEACEELPFAPHLGVVDIVTEGSDKLLGAQEVNNFAVREEAKFANACLFGPPSTEASFEGIDVQ